MSLVNYLIAPNLKRCNTKSDWQNPNLYFLTCLARSAGYVKKYLGS